MYKRLKLIHGIIFVCLVVLFFATRHSAAQKDGLLKIYFLNVGQGDSEFIETPNGTQILIDGGPDDTILSELSKAMPFYDHDIDMVIVSHHHADHIAGLINVLERYDVKTIVQADDIYKSPQFDAWQEAVANEGAEEIEAKAGQAFETGDGATINIIYPLKSYDGINLKNPHEANVTALLSYGSFRALFVGDMEKAAEDKIISSGQDIRSDILKVGHHGSKTSSSDEFLNSVKPQLSFIEVGAKNVYHLPYPGILTRLTDHGIPYYRTDEQGTMEVISDGNKFQLKTNL